ncbi:MAG TPA: cytochrome c [Polyangiaceae bacterium]|jgi:mono/diheme cytochrome c family protein|nr:cytochrome c [Polyangiaceae bacterium]
MKTTAPRTGIATAIALATFAVAACRTEQTIVTPDPHLERMLVQEKVLPYGASPVLPNGMAMQSPPEETLPVSAPESDSLVTSGAIGGHFADRIPIRIDHARIDRGETQFDTFCATCHGARGDGVSAVARKMALRKPPSLVAADVRAYAPGRIYRAVRHGYGLMPSYAEALSVDDAWGIVAYVRALQWAQGIPAADLPGAMRAELTREAP